jgi:hypothetical protein
MSEMTKTMAFVGTAALALVVAWFSRPAPATFDSGAIVGSKLYEFDPLTARRLKIVSFNSLTGEPQEFEVAQVGNTWQIPSKDGYPADAEDQMAAAAGAVNDKEVLRVASEDAKDHELYGVLDPTASERKVGEEGIGTKVTILDDSGKTLADLVIGKEVKDSPAHRYVRPAGRDIVFVAEIDPDKLTTNFADWIEKDLLKLSPWDIQRVQFKDYTLEFAMDGLQLRPIWTREGEMTVAYDDSESKWLPESLLVFDPSTQAHVDKPLAEDEELNTQALNDLKNALDDLKIVDVAKKPEQLSASLQKSEDFLQESTREAVMSLMKHGFAPIGVDEDTVEILSTEGEIIVTMKTGVEYVLRFGEVAIDSDDAPQEETAGTEESAEAKEAASGGNLNRYIFVLTRFNEDAIEKPAFETPPALPEGASDAAAASGEDAAAEEPTADAATSTDAAAANGESPDDAAAPDASSSEGAAAEEAAEGEEPQSETEKILAEQKRIEEANERKRTEYEDKIKQGKETVQELNERFGDWYYVVNEAEYKRIHLGRDQIVKKKEAPADAAGAEGGAAPAVDAGGFGKPGEAIPGLPTLPDPSEGDAGATESGSSAQGDAAAAPTEESSADDGEATKLPE